MSNLFDLIPPTWFYLMIIVDALIAFVIPVWVWWRQLQKTERIKLFTDLLKKHMLDPFKEEIMVELKEELVRICSNEIPHAVEKKIQPLMTHFDTKILEVRQDMSNASANMQAVYDLSADLKNQLARTLGAIGNAGRKTKQAERLLMYNELMKENPEKAQAIKYGLLFKQAGMIDQKLLDSYVAFQCGGIDSIIGGQLGGQNLQEMSTLQAGTHIQEVPPMSQEIGTEKADVGQMSEKEAELQLRSQFKASGMQPAVIDELFRQGKEARKNKLAEKLEGTEENGKKEETKRKIKDESGNSPDSDSEQSGSHDRN